MAVGGLAGSTLPPATPLAESLLGETTMTWHVGMVVVVVVVTVGGVGGSNS